MPFFKNKRWHFASGEFLNGPLLYPCKIWTIFGAETSLEVRQKCRADDVDARATARDGMGVETPGEVAVWSSRKLHQCLLERRLHMAAMAKVIFAPTSERHRFDTTGKSVST